MNDDIYNMKLHDEIILWRGLFITRVPGGWIYNREYEVAGEYMVGSTFVAFNNEFQGKGEKQ